MTTKKNIGGRPPIYGSAKTRVNLSLSIEGVAGLDKLAEKLGFSRSELVELVGRGELLLFKKEDYSRLGEPSEPVFRRSA